METTLASCLNLPDHFTTQDGTVKLTGFLEVPLIDMLPKSLICRFGLN